MLFLVVSVIGHTFVMNAIYKYKSVTTNPPFF